jgi:hypothetical protein
MEYLFFMLMSLIVHDVEPNRLIQNGEISIASTALDDETVELKIDYFLNTRWYAPVGDQRGSVVEHFPSSFVTEQGYADIEANGPQEFRNVTLTHLGHVDLAEFSNCHVMQISKNDGKWDAKVFYHAAVPSAGWLRLELTYNDLPGLGRYTIYSNLRR